MRCHDNTAIAGDMFVLALSRPQAKTMARDSRIPFVGTKSPWNYYTFIYILQTIQQIETDGGEG